MMNRWLKNFKWILSLTLLSTACTVSAEVIVSHPRADNYHTHNHRVHNRGALPFGGAWSSPNVIIQVPADPDYYAPLPPPVCQRVEVCNAYGDCWLERRCR